MPRCVCASAVSSADMRAEYDWIFFSVIATSSENTLLVTLARHTHLSLPRCTTISFSTFRTRSPLRATRWSLFSIS